MDLRHIKGIEQNDMAFRIGYYRLLLSRKLGWWTGHDANDDTDTEYDNSNGRLHFPWYLSGA